MIHQIYQKIKAASEAVEIISKWQEAGQTIVWTNGCFDLLHKGHIIYLAEAKDLGDRLVVGINDDASVSRLKGKQRPIFDLSSRQLKLAALLCTDLIIPFTADTPLELIKLLKPDVLVKGGDYVEDEIVGAKEVKAHGGSIAIIPLEKGHSSTALINKIRS